VPKYTCDTCEGGAEALVSTLSNCFDPSVQVKSVALPPSPRSKTVAPSLTLRTLSHDSSSARSPIQEEVIIPDDPSSLTRSRAVPVASAA
jgi:hypothetical protein